ncbi:MAG: hypothetical protein ACRD96_19730, partial [Bryobacteraceae bacterium]
LGVSVYAGRPFHFYYEPMLVKFLMTADLPATLLASISTTGLILLGISAEAASWVAALCWLCLGSLEWWVLGAYAHNKLTHRSARQARYPSE